MSDPSAEEKNIVNIKQTKIIDLKECLRKKDFENEHLKSKVVDCKMCQNLQVRVEELKSVNESLDLLVVAHCAKIRLLKEQSEPFYKVYSEFVSESFDDEKKVFENKISNLENDLTQRVKDFDDVKTELSRRTDKFETYFANLEKEK
nr:hypothetical protein [Tanacetum cinerariifolium]